jgi:hypothetical protein
MKTLKLINWILLAIYGLFILLAFLQGNKGSDAAGRGMANAFLMIGAIFFIILLLLNFGTSKFFIYLTLIVGFSPIGYLVYTNILSQVRKLQYVQMQENMDDGTYYFDDEPYQKLAASIKIENIAELRKLTATKQLDLNRLSKSNESMLEVACNQVIQHQTDIRLQIVNILLEAGADPNVSTTQTPSILAKTAGNAPTALLRLLLEHGANPNAKDYMDTPVLYKLIGYGTVKTEDIELALQHGADPDIYWKPFGTPLIRAAGAGYWEICNLLLNYKADVNYEPENRFSFWHYYYSAIQFYKDRDEPLPATLEQLAKHPAIINKLNH